MAYLPYQVSTAQFRGSSWLLLGARNGGLIMGLLVSSRERLVAQNTASMAQRRTAFQFYF